MISIRSQIALMAIVIAVMVAALLLPIEPGPPITVVKTKNIDARELIK